MWQLSFYYQPWSGKWLFYRCLTPSLHLPPSPPPFVIGNHNKLVNTNQQFDVKINNHSLERASTYKYLGIDLNESLSWDSHIDNIDKKVSTGLGSRGYQRCQELGFPWDLKKIQKWSIKLSSNDTLIIVALCGCRTARLFKYKIFHFTRWLGLELAIIILCKALHNPSPASPNTIFKSTSSAHWLNLRNSK